MLLRAKVRKCTEPTVWFPNGVSSMNDLAELEINPNALVLQFPPKLQCLFQPMRYKVFYGGRGAGRSWGLARACIIRAMQSRIRVLCARELQKSIKDSVHKLISDQIEAMGLLSQFDILQNTIICRTTGSEFMFEGIRHNVTSIKSIEGVDICWVEEAAKLTKDSYNVLTPSIRKEGSELWFSFNPDLETDFIYQELVISPPPDSYVVFMTYVDNPWFPDTLERDRIHMKEHDPDSYLNVWEGKCRVALTGAVYGKQLREAYLENRIGKVPYEPAVGVHTFWDLGRGDATAIWFAQVVGFEYHLIDYYENAGYHLDHYLFELQKRADKQGYLYDTAWLPHDAKAKTLGTKKSIQEQVAAKGHKVRIVQRLSPEDGINAARTVFPKCWIDELRCEAGLNALKAYHYDPSPEADGTTGRYQDKPVHDWSSHGADAFRYLAVGLREPRREPEQRTLLKIKPAGFSIDKLFLDPLGGFSQNWMK